MDAESTGQKVTFQISSKFDFFIKNSDPENRIHVNGHPCSNVAASYRVYLRPFQTR